jgi:hypothetical protein
MVGNILLLITPPRPGWLSHMWFGASDKIPYRNVGEALSEKGYGCAVISYRLLGLHMKDKIGICLSVLFLFLGLGRLLENRLVGFLAWICPRNKLPSVPYRLIWSTLALIISSGSSPPLSLPAHDIGPTVVSCPSSPYRNPLPSPNAIPTTLGIIHVISNEGGQTGIDNTHQAQDVANAVM